MTRRAGPIIALTMLLALTACSNYSGDLARARSVFLSGSYAQAGQLLEQKLPEAGRNDLLYLLEAGSAYHFARDYQKSRILLERADELARERSYISISQEAAAVIFDDRFKPYRAPDYERYLLLYLLAMNRFVSGDVEGALVELNRLIEFERRLANRGHPNPQPQAHFLAGLCYLRFAEFDNARQQFETAVAINPGNETYQRMLELSREYFERDSHGEKGFFLLFANTGLAPQRTARNSFTAIPAFASLNSLFNDVTVSLSVQNREHRPACTIHFDKMCYNWLDNMVELYLAREVGSVVAREVIADQVGKATDSEDAEVAARLVMLLARSPDLRSWRNLPQKVTVFVMQGSLGTYSARVNLRNPRMKVHGTRVDFSLSPGKLTSAVVSYLK
ncbi:MAG: hypothetical protein U5N86_00320 [Planctomycetota bacterium]|nr:hypothetical protein [Planctomycetota bacterium]